MRKRVMWRERVVHHVDAVPLRVGPMRSRRRDARARTLIPLDGSCEMDTLQPGACGLEPRIAIDVPYRPYPCKKTVQLTYS